MLMPHWDYFRTVESDLETSLRYVECDEANYGTYSLEFARLIMASCAEIDTVCKTLCTSLDPALDPGKVGISQYHSVITPHFPNLVDLVVSLPRYGKTYAPWAGWKGHCPPRWWNANNLIKHHRSTHFSEASLEHAINAVAGLLVIVVYFYKYKNGGTQAVISAWDGPRLFDLVEPKTDSTFEGGTLSWGYKLP